jgi:hypothetical protein
MPNPRQEFRQLTPEENFRDQLITARALLSQIISGEEIGEEQLAAVEDIWKSILKGIAEVRSAR